MLAVVRRIAFTVTMYYVWQERNQAVFNQSGGDAGLIVKTVASTVKLKLMAENGTWSNRIDWWT